MVIRRAITKVIFIVFIVLLSGTASGCRDLTGKQNGGSSSQIYYRDVPGVTDGEIRAIEDLRLRYTSFSVGMIPGIEAFEESGQIHGFDVMICSLLTELFGILFNPVILPGEELSSSLEEGKIDFICGLSTSDEYQHTWYTTDPIAERTLRYLRIVGSRPLLEIVSSRPPRYAFLKDSVTASRVAEFSDYPFQSFLVDDYESVYDLLKSGQVDAFLDEGNAEASFEGYDDVFGEFFFPIIYMPVSLAAQKWELEPVISIMRKYLQNNNARSLADMYKQGLVEYQKHKLYSRLNNEEKSYLSYHLEKSEAIPIAAEYYNYPISFYNSYEKSWQGIYFDVLEKVEALTGLRFELVNDRRTEWPKLLDMLESGDVSIVSELIPSSERYGRFLWPDTPLLSDYFALLSGVKTPSISIDDILNTRVGLPRNTAYADVFRNWFPNHPKSFEYESSDECFRALDRGEIDAVISSQRRLLALTNYYELTDYKTNLVFESIAESFIGFNKNETILCSIIEKALHLIDVRSISGQWVSKTYDYKAKLIRSQRPWLAGASVLLFCVMVLVLILFLRKRNERDRLETQVQYRTAELNGLKEDLENALETANAGSRAKSVFLATMGHEIRTPMNAIIGMSSIGKTSADAERKDYCFARIEDAATHLLSVINDILDMSRIEANKFDLLPSEFKFEKMLQQVVNVVSLPVEEKKQKLRVYFDRNIPEFLYGDAQRLAQVIANLVWNAVKFTPEEGSIRIGTYYLGEEDGICTIRITVTDTGIGISPEQMKKLFHSFQQAEGSLARKFGGSGLGLIISKTIIELMGGAIWVESELGEGATFGFTIKVKRSKTEEPKPVTHEVWENDVRILTVDDDGDTLFFIRKVLKEYPVSVDAASSGEEALEMVERNGSYDIYLINWKLPGIDGMELAGILKGKENSRGNVSVIMFSSASWDTVEVDAQKPCDNKILHKPLFPSSITESIDSCLGIEYESSTEAGSSAVPVFPGRHILLAEDVEINYEIVQALLEPTKLEIDWARDGSSAVSMFQENPDKYDIILMDVQMPGMDGYTATRTIRAMDIPKAKNIPIIAMTANVLKDDVEDSLDAGMNGHIGKPLDFGEVLDMLRTYLPHVM